MRRDFQGVDLSDATLHRGQQRRLLELLARCERWFHNNTCGNALNGQHDSVLLGRALYEALEEVQDSLETDHRLRQVPR
jgi:hypothetical protein